MSCSLYLMHASVILLCPSVIDVILSIIQISKLYFYCSYRLADFYYMTNTLLALQVSLFTNPIWLVKTRLQLQTPYHGYRTYSGFSGMFSSNCPFQILHTCNIYIYI